MSAADQWLETYLDRYIHLHRAAADPQGEEMTALLSCYREDARYCDMPSGRVWVGRDEIRDMCIGGYRFGDNEKHIVRSFTNGKHFAYEIESIGNNKLAIGKPGERWVLHACSFGTFDDDGLIADQNDYWDRKSWAIQVGVEQPLDWSQAIEPGGSLER
jgi:hypothetical protein